MIRNTEKTTALITLGTTVLLLAMWGSYNDYISNERLIGYYDARNPHFAGVVIEELKSYPKAHADDIYKSEQTVEFSFDCKGNEFNSIANRWVLHLTGTAFDDTFGYMKISIDDSSSKRFRTFAFKDYRYRYVIPFNKHSKDLPKKVRVNFSFSGANSGSLFEMPLVELIAEKSEGVPLPSNTIIPTSFKRYHKSGNCQVVSKKIREAP